MTKLKTLFYPKRADISSSQLDEESMLLDDFTSICLDFSINIFFFHLPSFSSPFLTSFVPSLLVQIDHLLHARWKGNEVGSSVQFSFSRSVISHSLQPHGLQDARLPCPSPALELVQTHIHWVDDVNSSNHLMFSSPSPPAFNLSQHQGLFQWVSSLHQVAKVLEFQLQHPVNIRDWFPLGWTGLTSTQSKWLSRVFPNTTAQKHQFLWCSDFFYWWALTAIYDNWKNHSFDYTDLCRQSNVSAF